MTIIENHSSLSLDIASKGYCIFDIENTDNYNALNDVLKDSLQQDNLQELHSCINTQDVNASRLKAYRSLNILSNWEELYFSLAKNKIEHFLGPDLAIQSKLNLSIQMPKDSTSVLQLHTDALSGQSIFELVLWVPFTPAFDSNAMYIFRPEISKIMLSDMPKLEKEGMSSLFNKYEKEATFIKIDPGKALLFSPTMFHGNILNITKSTRVSINCRFKNIFTHEASSGERRLGSFYKVLKMSEVTKLGLSYRDDLVSFL
ncbi:MULTISPECIES: sporadic carbohydrate cluster 2OG-Fe(II) oxygenase [Prochlorococcus]|uniref:2OG-Fe(II) dioxygenase superfamily protein n=1 Tax=Prochlorococcus marinus (strain SARG / CCMP1375 / SS120) TaxID=167539 RepID=Q7VB17_PROMA|nr:MULTISPECIES: sporadic carbohydrate cluster 2OG-Fe(II) oxygenase [Prochlorococcus]AAQ00327.1 2OG-Fe(II) dioxygenase superfamily protein [Prochlorococcus marinus subsp. marinus str. CCMP1375]KGG10183.1 hypothetical protein EV04_2007 [Prochlorococcus marinus str. LG]KGG22223.1 hypothetical protein EV08_0399 [Prochlorococcus marinus str. SS2]KGG24460.1 hypothetical protein EV09_0090 [Prochlorococcus marinus str. SS35]KGG33355.1 hypothetical protein EV10_0562 [Prochlorococcus marinus str. SS51]